MQWAAIQAQAKHASFSCFKYFTAQCGRTDRTEGWLDERGINLKLYFKKLEIISPPTLEVYFNCNSILNGPLLILLGDIKNHLSPPASYRKLHAISVVAD